MNPQPMIAVRDVPASRQWYETVLGLESAHGGDEYDQLVIDGHMVLQLHRWDAHEHPHLGDPELPVGNGTLLWYQTAHFDDAVKRIQDQNAKVLEGPKINPLANHREIWIEDIDGYVVVIAGASGDV